MKIVCPKCNEAIPSDGVNVAKALAFCARCGEAFSLGTFVTAPTRTPQPPDAQTVLTRAGESVAIAFPAGGFKGAGCFFLFFSAFWNGITWTILIATYFGGMRGKGAASAGAGLFTGLFLVPFILIGLITLGVAIYCIWGDSALAMDRKNILFERRLFGRKWTHTYDAADVTDIRRTESYSQNNQPVYGVGIHFKSRKIPLTFGTALSEAEKNWLVGELYAYWKEQS